MRRSRLGLFALAAVACALPAAGFASSPPPGAVGYRLTFTGSGTATSAFPPAASNATVFTSTISWKLIYDVTIHSTPGLDFGWAPGPGSSIEGSSIGVAAPDGTPIEEGCDHISFSLDTTGQWGAALDSRAGRKVVISLFVPGFHADGLVMFSPPKCSDPFPSSGGGPGCPDVNSVIAPTVRLDATRKTQSSPLSGQCDVSDERQTEHWTGTVTAAPRALPLQFDGHTAQRCAKWDDRCAPDTNLPISFDLANRTVSDLVADDEGTCPHDKTSASSLAPPPARLDAHGRFHMTYSTQAGAYHVQVSGRVTGTKASGVLSTTSRFNAFGGTLDPSGTILCHATNVHWTAVGSFVSAG